jgi:hypothetical protein
VYLFYVIGVPGAGKTTVVTEALSVWRHPVVHQKPFLHVEYIPQVLAQLGGPRPGGFGGTDALSMSVQPKVLQWLQDQPYRVVIGEGDRLANASFFKSVMTMGVQLIVVYLHTDLTRKQMQARYEARNSHQNETWIRSRYTKVKNLITDLPHVKIDNLRTQPSHVAAFQLQLALLKAVGVGSGMIALPNGVINMRRDQVEQDVLSRSG